MTIFYKRWRITDRLNDKKMLVYGYKVQELVGKQWKKASYFPRLSQTVNEMFEREARLVLENEIVDMDNISAKELFSSFAKHLDSIKAGILEVVNDQ